MTPIHPFAMLKQMKNTLGAAGANGKIAGTVSLGALSCVYAGFLVYGEYSAGDESARALLADFARGAPDFNALLGSFRVHIHNGETGERVFFGDNSGACRYYYDARGNFAESFLDALALQGDKKPDYPAIAQFLRFGCIYSERTQCEGVLRTDPDDYYIAKDGRVYARSKGLTPLYEAAPYEDMHSLMERLTGAAKGLKNIAVITGGTDSRAVLAHLMALNVPLELAVSEQEGAGADVEIAKEIAAALKLPLHIAPRSARPLPERIAACDGVSPLSPRDDLLQKSLMLAELGFELEFGGVAGELYKNSFINQDFPFYGGQPDYNKFYRYKVDTAGPVPVALTGPALADKMDALSRGELELIAGARAYTPKARAYNELGYKIMQCRAATVTNSASRFYALANPLLERGCAALVRDKSPYSLEMQAFQRGEIVKFCPGIMDIKTDRGNSCNPARMRRDFLNNYAFLARVAFKRLRRGRALPPAEPAAGDMRESAEYASAIAACKRAGILPGALEAKAVSLPYAARLIVTGSLFV